MERLNVTEFIAKLKSKLIHVEGIEDAISTLEKQKINGMRAKSLTTENLFTIGILFGDAMDIEEAIKEIEKDIENEPEPTTGAQPIHVKDIQISTPKTSSIDGLSSESLGRTGKVKLVSDTTNDKLQEKPVQSLRSCKRSSKGNDNYERLNKSPPTFPPVKDSIAESSKQSGNRLSRKKEAEESSLDKSSDSESNDDSQKDDKKEPSVDESSDSASNDDDSDDSEKDNKKFECLEEYFTATDWKKMSTYDKRAHLNQFRNYHRLLEMAREVGKSCETVKKPSFMVLVPVKDTSRTKKVSPNEMKDKEKKTKDKEKEKGKETEHKEKKKEGKAKKKEDKDKQKEDKENNAPKRKNNESRRVPYVKKRKVSKTLCHGPNDMPESEYVETLLEYDVEAILEDAGKKLKDVRDALSKDGIVFGNQRRLMIRTLTKYLFFESVEDPKEITQFHKEGLASSICRVWPKFKDNSATRYSWHILFHRQTNTGFIANVVQTIYKTLDDSQRRRPRKQQPEKSKPTSASTSGADFDPAEEHKWISLLVANRLNHNDIIESMQNSFSDRRNWIMAKSPSITEILANYPHLMSYRGEVLSIEFSNMEPGKSSILLKEFGALTASVKKICLLEELEDFDCEGLQVLLALSELLPSPNILKNRKRSKERAKPAVEDVITIFTRGTDVQSVVAAKRKEASGKPVQPYLLASVPDRAIVKLFLVCDSNLIEVEGTSFLTGLDLLFKSFFVFNVEYPLGWTFVFQFLEKAIFKINPETMSLSGKELLKRLSSV